MMLNSRLFVLSCLVLQNSQQTANLLVEYHANGLMSLV